MSWPVSEWQIHIPKQSKEKLKKKKKAAGFYEVCGRGIGEPLESCAWSLAKDDLGMLGQLAIEEKKHENDSLIDT